MKMFLICVALQVFLVVPAHNDVIITVEVNAYRLTRVTFSEKYFNQFYKCLCEQKTVCKASYDSSKNVTEVWHEDHGKYSTISGPSYYYYCTYEAFKKISCERSVRGLYYETFHVLGTECHYSCVGLFWFYRDERTDFSNSGLSVQYCYDHNCNYCSESNAAATTRTTTTTTTTTARTATAITTTTTTLATTASATTTTTTIPSSTTIKTTPETSSTRESTPASPASIFPENDSRDDPQVGLIIGVVFTIIIIAFIIAVIGIFLWRRKRKQEASIPLNGTQNSTASNNFSNVISEVQNRLTKTRNNYPYNVAPSYYSNINSNCENNGHFAMEAMSLSSENSIKNFQTKSPENDLENTKTSPERSTDDSEAVTPSPTHNSQTANQLSRCSFVRPISDGLSNENTDLIEETNNAATSQNHIYYVLEGGKEDDDITDSQRNIYFELEKQEDVSETDTEED